MLPGGQNIDPNLMMGIAMLSAARKQPKGADRMSPILNTAAALAQMKQQQALMDIQEKKLAREDKKYEMEEKRRQDYARLASDYLKSRSGGQEGQPSVRDQLFAAQIGQGNFDEYLSQTAPQKQPTPKVVGNSLVDPMTGKPIYTAPPKPLQMARELSYFNSLSPEQQAQVARMKTMGRESNPFGSGMVGQAYARYAAANGIPLPDVAEHILQQPQLRTTPTGDMVEYTPGLPQRSTPAPAASPGVPASARQQMTGGPKVRTVMPGEKQGKIDAAKRQIKEIATFLNEAKESGGNITGVPGAVSSAVGGYLRQIPGVSKDTPGIGWAADPRGEQLARKIESLKAVVTPLVLGEKGSKLSDTDRKRVDQIVGDMTSGKLDDEGLQNSLIELSRIIWYADQ